TRLLEEQLDGDDLTSLIAHVESCSSCQERLKELTSDGSLHLEGGPWEFDRGRPLTDPWLTANPSADGPAARLRVPRRPAGAAEAPGDGGTCAPGFPGGDGYEIWAELGQGGMGVVYKARQRRLNRLVALKMIRAGSLARPEDRQRFRIEAEVVAQLRHPNIIQ